MRVLYVDGVGPFGGASRSLYEVVRALPAGSVEPLFVIQRGTIETLYGEVAHDLIATRGLTRFDNTRYGYYRGVRWLVTLRELFHVPFTIMAMHRARRRWKHVDLIHANEITELPAALLARLLFRVPVVVHVRSLARVDPRSYRCRWLNAQLHRVNAAIAIDEGVRATLPATLDVDVIHNAFTPVRAPTPDSQIAKKLSRLRSGSLKLGFVGNLQHSKGLIELVEALRIVRASGRDIELVIAGGVTRKDTGLRAWVLRRLGLFQDIETTLREHIEREGLRDHIHLLGHTSDVQRVYESIDVLCFPSHFDAPGRPVFEAGFSGVPSIVAVRNPRPDTLVPGETGLAIPTPEPAKLAEAITYFADQPDEVRRMGANARRLAKRNCTATTNAQKLLAVYERVVSRSSGAIR